MAAKGKPAESGPYVGEDSAKKMKVDKPKDEKLNEEERDDEDQMSPGKTALEKEVSEKSLSPAAQRQMVAKEHAIKVQELTKSEDVQVGTTNHPYALTHSNTDQASENLLKSDNFYVGGQAPTLAPPGAIIRQTVLCKSDSCGCRYPALYTACPSCGDGQTVSRLLPNSGHVGLTNSPYTLEKSGVSVFRPVHNETDEDVCIEGPSPVMFRNRTN